MKPCIIDKFYFSKTCMKDPKTALVFMYLLALRRIVMTNITSLKTYTGLSESDIASSLLKLCTEKLIRIKNGNWPDWIYVEILYNENNANTKKGGKV